MLINATQPEELRVAMVDGQKLFDLDIETSGREQKKGNIYKARIIRYEPSLEALFVYYGSERHGFLPLREVAHNYFAETGVEELNRSNIKDILPEGRDILIQVDKEERGTKGAALTTFISLAGCYLVLMPNNPRAGGISRRVDGEERAELREVLSALDVPEGMGIIIRTAGVGRKLDELQWDLSVLLSQWKAIQDAATAANPPALIHQEGNVVIRAVRDYLRPDVDEILVDDPEVYQNVCAYVKTVRSDFLSRIKLYQDPIPLFSRYQIGSQIESAFRRNVQLPSGGALVIDHTEALVSIDINSAKATRGGGILKKRLSILI
jgi:ribonuclease E